MKKQLGINILKFTDVFHYYPWLQLKNSLSIKSTNEWGHTFNVTGNLLGDKLAVKVQNETGSKIDTWLNPYLSFVSKQLHPFVMMGGFNFVTGDLDCSVNREAQEGEKLGYSLGLNLGRDKFSIAPMVIYELTNSVKMNLQVSLDSNYSIKNTLGL